MSRTPEIWRAAPWAVAVVGAGAALLLLARDPGRVSSADPASPVVSRLAEKAVAAPAASAGEGSLARAPLEPGFDPGPVTSEDDWDLDPSPLRAGRPAGEREHYREFLEEARRAPDSLAESAPEVLRGEAPDYRKVALLRALYDSGSPATAEGFALALRELPDRSSPHASSVPQFAVRFLGTRAGEDAGARAILRAAAFGPGQSAVPAVRRQAIAHLARTSNETELFELAPKLRVERDELLRAVFAAGLLSNPEERTVALLFSDLLAAREAFAGDSSQHQDSDSR